MKKLLSVLLTLTLLLALSAPAFAAEDEPPDTTATVSTFEELQAAVAAADDGDTIVISNPIGISGADLITDKQIIITISDDFPSRNVLSLYNGAILDGFTFARAVELHSLIDVDYCENPVIIRNCTFTASGYITHIGITGSYTDTPNNVRIENCHFENAERRAISVRVNVNAVIENCSFSNCSADLMWGGAIDNSGTMLVSNSTITDCTAPSGGGIGSNGTLTLSNCQIYGNSANVGYGAEIFSLGKLTITDEAQEGAGFYDETTGEKIPLPLTDYEDTAKLIYLTDEAAAANFAPTEDEPPAPADEEEQEQEPQEQEQEQEDGEQEQEREEEQPKETPPAETPTEPQTPEESTDTDSTPPASPAPTYTPPTYSYSRPSGRSTTPTTTIEEEPAIKADAPALVFACGEAVIDRTRSVVLAGYDDGELHLDDTLTRAQMATIIYRLLDADTLAKFDTAESAFNDVSPNAWYSRYVSTIAKAGIVVGTGNGYYSPDGTLTWAQILTVLRRFVAPQAYTLQNIQYDGWAAEAIQTAAALGWIEDTADFAPNAVITRGEFVELVNGVLELNSTV